MGAVTRDLGAWCVLGTRGSLLLPSPAGTGWWVGAVSIDLGLADDRGRVWAVTSDLGGWCRDSRGLVGAGEKMVTSLPSPADTGSGSSSRSHCPSLEAFSLAPKEQGGRGHLDGDGRYILA